MAMPRLDIHALSIDDRLELVEQLWESLAAEPDAVPLTDAQRAELDRRLDEIDRDGGAGVPWDEVVARIRDRRP